jgi:hypothetical protein
VAALVPQGGQIAMHACTLAGEMMDFLLQVRVLLFLHIICTTRTRV